ncbi:MAG: hypothetical protein HYX62_04620 [Gammaproteobacteria bacterium]|nr:hypothetical protein [Gammaproteobacteria bacterium]
MLRRYSNLFLIFWIVAIQAMSPLAHAHVGGDDGDGPAAAMGAHIHVLPVHLKNGGVDYGASASSDDASAIDTVPAAVGMPIGIEGGLAEVPPFKAKKSPPAGVPPSIPEFPAPIVLQHLVLSDVPSFQPCPHISPCAPRAPPFI